MKINGNALSVFVVATGIGPAWFLYCVLYNVM